MKYFCTSCGFQQRGWNHPCSHCLKEGMIEARGPVQDIIEPESGLLWKTVFYLYKKQALEKERDMVTVMDQLVQDCPEKE